MTKRMLIDATHPEETRVVIADDSRLLEFDVEIASKRQLKGNIYLAKVTRVEPSLQAAFVEYGGNRHGFLPFSEIHPDYYQLPQADREQLEELERELERRASEADVADEDDGSVVTEDSEEETADMVEEIARRRARILRSYRIQEVIKRRQILLVQVVKEERGNKGAALTTYLSLPGRYCVLMPNTPRGGGISRKITNPNDRKRLKKIAQELDVPSGMGLIIRTAGQERSKAEIRRDYEYLLRLWNEIRETTLESIAPCLIYEEGNLVKRALRDFYSRDIKEILVEGEEAYRSARRVMQMMTPSRTRQIKLYKDEIPLFVRYGIEDQLDGILNPVVELPSGGSIVIHTSEALTAIDVNSGRSTRERHIDETALKTNLEAADEIARQLRLRDLAGLIVIDFIDMNEPRHQRQVERRLREALKGDRARLQVGRISTFGLLELSRQRLRPSLQELAGRSCPLCSGTGTIRSVEGVALQALRRIQEEGIKNEAAALKLSVPGEVAIYLLNHKRESLTHLEKRYGLRVEVVIEEQLTPQDLVLEVSERRETPAADEETTQPAERAETAEKPGRCRRRWRRRRRSAETREEVAAAGEAAQEETRADEREEPEAETSETAAAEEGTATGNGRRRRRRRRPRRSEAEPTAAAAASEPEEEGGRPAPPEDAAEIPVAPEEPVPSATAEAGRETDEPAAERGNDLLLPETAVPSASVARNGDRDVASAAPSVPEAALQQVSGLAETASSAAPVEEHGEEPARQMPETAGEESQESRRSGWWSRWLR